MLNIARVFKYPHLLVLIVCMALLSACASCGSSGSTGNGGDGSSDGIDRSSLPDAAPPFEISPLQFPNGLGTDLTSIGIYNLTSDCDVVHYGWDYMPNWDSYPDDRVPVLAVADGIISNVTLRSTNTYDGQEHNTYAVRLAVAKEVDVHYTFEPFITFDGTYASQWLNVTEGSTISAGDVIGYLPKAVGNIGENLIHIDWKIGTGSDQNDYVCPTAYFSSSWRADNEQTLIGKILGSCTQLCYE